MQCLGPSEGAAELAVVYEDIFLIVESWFLSYISLSLFLCDEMSYTDMLYADMSCTDISCTDMFYIRMPLT